MLFAISATDIENSLELRLADRQAHRARIQELMDQGRLIAAGPHPAVESNDPGVAGFTGSLIIAEFADLEQATRWANEDPYVKNGAYADVTIKPYIKVFP